MATQRPKAHPRRCCSLRGLATSSSLPVSSPRVGGEVTRAQHAASTPLPVDARRLAPGPGRMAVDERSRHDQQVADRFAVLVPVKPPAFAKSRLADLGDDARRDLADRVRRRHRQRSPGVPVVDRVLVVTDDRRAGRAACPTSGWT